MTTVAPARSLLTHLARPMRGLDAMLDVYARDTMMRAIHERADPDMKRRTVLGPMHRDEVGGSICLVREPDGNNGERPVGQVLG